MSRNDGAEVNSMAATTSCPPFHVIATDLDGTLLNDTHEISSYSKAVLQRVVNKYEPYEVSVVLASGRPHSDVMVQLDSLDLPDYSGYIVSSNGARVHRIIREKGSTSTDGKDHRTTVHLEELYSSTMDPEDVYYLLSLLPDDEEEIAINLYQGDNWLCTLDWTSELVYFKKSGLRYNLFSSKDLRKEYLIWKENASTRVSNPLGNVSKVYFGTDNVKRMFPVTEKVCKERPHLVVTSSSPYCTEWSAEGVTKASGISALLPYLFENCLKKKKEEKGRKRDTGEGVKCMDEKKEPKRMDCVTDGREDASCGWTLASCIAFGDGLNDEVMLSCVGKGCVMGNANTLLKSHLPSLEVIGRNTEEGVGEKIKEVFCLQLDD